MHVKLELFKVVLYSLITDCICHNMLNSVCTSFYYLDNTFFLISFKVMRKATESKTHILEMMRNNTYYPVCTSNWNLSWSQHVCSAIGEG